MSSALSFRFALYADLLLVEILDNDEMVVFWIGSGASPQLLRDLFGVDDYMSIDRRMVWNPPITH